MSRPRRPIPSAPRATAATVTASEFKATCLELMDRVARERTAIVVTKHGVPVAQLVPADDPAPPDAFGLLAGTVLLPPGASTEAALATDASDWPEDGDVFPPTSAPEADGAGDRAA